MWVFFFPSLCLSLLKQQLCLTRKLPQSLRRSLVFKLTSPHTLETIQCGFEKVPEADRVSQPAAFQPEPRQRGKSSLEQLGSSLSSGAEKSKKTHFVLISRTSERALLYPVRFTTDLLLQEYDNCTTVELPPTRGRAIIM